VTQEVQVVGIVARTSSGCIPGIAGEQISSFNLVDQAGSQCPGGYCVNLSANIIISVL